MSTPRRPHNQDNVFYDSEDDDDAEFRSSTWNFIENSNRSFSATTTPRSVGYFNGNGGRGSANGVETRTAFREFPTVPISATRTASTYQFHYVTRRVSSTGARHTTVELEHSSRDLGAAQQEPQKVVQREIPVQMVGNGGSSAHSYSRFSLANDVIQRYSSQTSSGISPHQRLSSYSLHSIVGKSLE
eukprot:NP_492999.3 Uncharacterized protein CELE_T02G6.1 [Caenorhabditis elegans]